MKKKKYIKFWEYLVYKNGKYVERKFNTRRDRISCRKLDKVGVFNNDPTYTQVVSFKYIPKQEVLMRIQLNMFDNI